MKQLHSCKSTNPHDAAKLTVDILLLFKQAGFVVTSICDPAGYRHHSKRASIERIRNRERKRIEGLLARYKISQTTQTLANDEFLSGEEKGKLQEDITALNKTLASCERISSSQLDCQSFSSTSYAIYYKRKMPTQKMSMIAILPTLLWAVSRLTLLLQGEVWLERVNSSWPMIQIFSVLLGHDALPYATSNINAGEGEMQHKN